MRILTAPRWSILGVAGAVVASGLVPLGAAPAVAADPDFVGETWRALEVPLTSTAEYDDPLFDVEVTARFTGPQGRTLTRPVFWDGGDSWKVRFAAPTEGLWTMEVSASNTADAGLNGVTRTIDIDDYSGDQEIYQRGFLRASDDGHHLAYADGTPFFYLGETHWIMPHERWDSSNAVGVESQFQYIVDKRVDQNFTVYQSQPIFQPHHDGASHGGPEHPHDAADEEALPDLTDGFSEADVAGFQRLDLKFDYIANAGLVHANAMVDWVTHPKEHPDVFTTDFMATLARYWNARYGAYPAIWTVAQEIDQDVYGQYAGAAMAPWTAAIEAMDAADAYDQPIMPHMENTGRTTSANSRFGGESWHTGWASQPQWQDVWDLGALEGFWSTGKPALVYEGPYEDFWTDSRRALSMLYKAYLTGMRGYGYGISGIWNDIYSPPGEPIDSGTDYQLYDQQGNPTAKYQWWFDAAQAETGDQLALGVDFLRSLKWWELTPRFGDATWADFTAEGTNFLASDGNDTYVALFADGKTTTGTVRGLDEDNFYTASWFDPRTGESTVIDDRIEGASRSWSIGAKPSSDDYVLLLEKGDEVGDSILRPVPSVDSGSVSGPTLVELSAPGGGTAIHFTTDGTTPTESSSTYTGPIRIASAGPVELKAIAVAAGREPSGVTTVTYTQSLTDLAASATTTASSGSGVARAFDHDPVTAWNACDGCWDGQWLQMDFGRPRAVDTVFVAEQASVTGAARVEYWHDGSWKPTGAAGGEFGPGGQATTWTFSEVETSKLRLRFESGTGTAPRVVEFSAFDDPDLTVASSYAASSQFNPEQGAAKAFDGMRSTNWQACEGCWSGEWLEVDFGRERAFNTVEISEYDNRVRDYRIEVWDGSQWRTAHSARGPFGTLGESSTVVFPKVTGSKMRLAFDSGVESAPIIYELSVYDDPDLTTGATYSASSQRSAGEGPEKAFDGLLATNWQSVEGAWGQEWLAADFRQPTTFDTVEIAEYGNRIGDYRIEYWDGSDWLLAHEGTGPFGTQGQSERVSFAEVTGSQMRIRFLTGSETAPIIYEMKVLHRGTIDEEPDLTTGGAYSASSQISSDQGAARAFDGIGSTNWQACGGCWAGQWLEVDFGEVRTFNTVEVSEYDNRVRNYRILVWDGAAWVTVHTGTGPFGTLGESSTVGFPQTSGSKLRLAFDSGTGFAPIIYELSVFRRGAEALTPPAPTAVTVAAVSHERARISWDAVASAIGYRVYVDATDTVACEAPATATTCEVSGLTAGSTHRYTVAASNSDGEGVRSESVAVTLPDEPAPVDKTRPGVVLIAPTTAGPFRSLTVEVDATDDVGLAKIVANIYRAGVLVKSTQTKVDGAKAASHKATVTLPDGEYSVRYNAHDLAGNVSATGSTAFSVDSTAPTATIKDGSSFTVGSDGAYDLVSFKLFDAGKVDRVVINGKVKDLTDNTWSDVNFLKPGVFGARAGENTLVVHDVAGNTRSYTFTLN